MSTDKFVSVAELAPAFTWLIDFPAESPSPDLNIDELYLNTRRLYHIETFGAIGSLSVQWADRLPASESTLDVNTINNDGSIVASWARAPRKGPSESVSRDKQSIGRPPGVIVSLNHTTISGRVARRVKLGTSTQSAWAWELDRSLRRGINDWVQTDSLTLPHKLATDIFTHGADVSINSLAQALPELTATRWATDRLHSQNNAIQEHLYKTHGGLRFRPDRMATIGLLTAIPGIITARPSKA